MKIAFLHQTLGLVNRGSEISVQLVANALAKKHKVLVIQSGPLTKNNYRSLRVAPQKSVESPCPINLTQKILFRLQLDSRSRSVKHFTNESLSHLVRFDPDVVVATNGAGQVRIIRHNLPRAKVVVFGRAGIGHDDLGNLRESPDLFVALTPTALDWASDHKSDKTKVVYIPNPVVPTRSKKIALALPNPIILCVGALSKYKNITNVIRATKALSVSLLLIGDGEQAADVSDLLSVYPGDFRWIKSVEPIDMPNYYASADVFCFVPDPQESFGRVYLEAMDAGLPIVASDDLVRRSIVGEQGIYINPHKVDDISVGIKRALELGHIDYKRQLALYKMSNVIKKIEKSFNEITD